MEFLDTLLKIILFVSTEDQSFSYCATTFIRLEKELSQLFMMEPMLLRWITLHPPRKEFLRNVDISGGDISTALPPCQWTPSQLEIDRRCHRHLW